MDVNGRNKLSEHQLEEQLQTVLRFLESVHPVLVQDREYRPAVELRPLPRGEKNYMLSKSLVIWDLSKKTVSRLRSFLERHNGATTCLYYSVFTYDNNKETLTSKGKPAKTGKITTNSAIFAEEIALDFDDIGFDEYVQLVDRFEELGIYALWVNTGHGYHAHILLKEPLDDKTLLRRCVYKFRSKGFYCDSKCVDPARIMRLPGTLNNKCFSDDAYAAERSNPPVCTIVQDSAERYALEDVLEKLESLPTVSEEDEQAYLNAKETRSKSAPSAAPKGKKGSEDSLPDEITLRKITYNHLSQFDLPTPVEKMLAYTPKGYRNSALGFLIKFFKTQYKMGKVAILETLELWGREACEPAYDPQEFKDDFSRLYYHYNGLGYDPALARMYGHIDFQNLILLRKKDIHLPARFFGMLAEMDVAEVRTYLAVKMLEHLEEPTTREKIAETLGVSNRALTKNASHTNLIKKSLLFVKKGNARMGVPDTYHTSRMNSSHDGYVVFSYNDIRAYMTELCEQGGRTRSNGELKLYLYMRWKFHEREIYMSQENLGKNIGVEQNSISVMVYRLRDKHFLKIEKKHFSSFLESCEYTLLR